VKGSVELSELITVAVINLGYVNPQGLREKSQGIRQIFISLRLLMEMP